jgi:hypothetical protein
VLRCAVWAADSVFDIAHRLVTQCRLWQQQEKRGELQGRLGLVWPSELLHWERTLEELRPARARLLWQAGLVRPMGGGIVTRTT